MVSTNEVIAEQAPVVNLPLEQTASNGPEGDFEKAQKKYQLGKKNLLLNKYDDAVNNIGEACKVYSSKFGELAPECAELYFYYGKALLEFARVENTVLGNALSGVPEDTEPIDDSRYGNPDDVAAEEKEEIADKVIDAMCEADKTEKPMDTTDVEKKTTEESKKEEEKPVENGDKVEPTEVKKIEEPTTTTTTSIEEKKTENEAAPVESTSTENGTEKKEETDEVCGEEEDDDEDDEAEEADEEDLTKNDGAKGEEGDNDDISSLQRAWEMFELAKLIFSKNFDNDPVYKTKRIAECLIKLGEISIEQESYAQALSDIQESINMQEKKESIDRDERMLAESYYQFGLAYQFSEQFQLAGDSYQKSINILQLRIDKLKGLIEETSDEFEKNTYKDEITELEAILPEIVSKLEEIKEQGEQALKLIKEAKECFINKIDDEQQQQQHSKTNGSSTEVKDITSLVKSKRKISDNNDETAIKKTKVDDEKTPETEAIPIETDQVPTTTTTASPIETETPTSSEVTTTPVENGNSE